MSVESLRSAYRSLMPPDRLRAEAISRFAAHGASDNGRERPLLLVGGLCAVLVAGVVLMARFQTHEPPPVSSHWSLSRLSTTTEFRQNIRTPVHTGRSLSSVTSGTSSVVAAARGSLVMPRTTAVPSAAALQSMEK